MFLTSIETALLKIDQIKSGRIVGLILLIGMFAITIYYLRKDKAPFVRRVAALDAIEEGVGRGTELGKPIMMTYGGSGFTYSTLAALSILSYTATLSARNNTKLIVPIGGGSGALITRPVAMDIIKTAYRAEGREDLFNEANMPFVSLDSFSSAAGIAGLMLTERPAMYVLCGNVFGAASMMLAEQSNMVDAMTITQASGLSYTAVLACASDYVMIGDEAMVAGAYLSGDPGQLASIVTQDIYKFIAIGLTIIGIILKATGNSFISNLLST